MAPPAASSPRSAGTACSPPRSARRRSAARQAARQAGIAFAVNDRFIDHDKTLPAVKAALLAAARQARRNGNSVAIGHPHALTAQALREMIPTIEREGVRLVSASEVVE